MEIGSSDIIINQEEQMMMRMSKGKQLPFSCSSSPSPSPSPSSSSSQQKSSRHVLPLPQIYDNVNQNNHHHHQTTSWLATKYDPEQEDAGAAAKLDQLMDINVNDDTDQEESGGPHAGQPAAAAVIDKEHMFDKVVTPSDVGKLNRLVIPKQHAEKYFPLDSSNNDKGLLLNFEDRTGKAWRFRYSYWNSSQSYVMTKGWSRFVKEKKLDAGDIVSFQRGVGEAAKDRLYIDWRRRPDQGPDHSTNATHVNQHHHHHHFSSIPWSPLLMRPPYVARDQFHFSNFNRNNVYCNNSNISGGGSSYGYEAYGYNSSSSSSYNYSNVSSSNSGAIVYMRSSVPVPQQVGMGMGMVQWQQGPAGSGVVEPMVFESVPVVQGKAAAKRLRLFGVNMDCPITIDSSQECDRLSSTTSHSTNTMQAAAFHHQPSQIPSPSHHSLQLRLYNGTPSSTQFLQKGKSSMSLDLDI